MRAYKYIYYLFLFILSMAIISGCSVANTNSVPADFIFILDAHSAGGNITQNMNIQINAKGEGIYERYNTGGVIISDGNGRVVYDRSQVVEVGDFKLDNKQLMQLWQVINENNFYQLTDDYRLSLGSTYAFILIEANGQRHQVDNIGMEVPEIKAIVEATNSLLPENIVLDYGQEWDFSNFPTITPAPLQQTQPLSSVTPSPFPNEIFTDSIILEPDSPAVLNPMDRVYVSLRYATNKQEGVKMWAQPYTNGERSSSCAFSGTSIYPFGEGEVTSYFFCEDKTAHVDQVIIQMYSVNNENLLAEVLVDVNYSLDRYSVVAPTPVPKQIFYYSYVPITEEPPTGSVVIYGQALKLTSTGMPLSLDPAADLTTALEAALRDSRNEWTSSAVEIIDVTFANGHADIVLQGEYFGVGDVVLIAARMQILMTVFANASVETAAVTLNGDTIANMGVSSSMNAKPADYVFTRAEMETFMGENAYVVP